ncbi:CDP-glycerol glycerophosphotransferase family protein [Luteibacter sp. NPDC031894]|uniref:CDP-glycerol glycerophosphotransferase family protein n=1 Tax=Luteibacter sp. NPDC031894 TaxID=3390572 RepID=UPI003D07335A
MNGAGGILARAVIGVLTWLAWLPVRLLVPRRRDWIAVLGRGDGTFVDNCKYFFIGAQSDAAWRVVYVTSHADVAEALGKAGTPVVRYPTLRGAWFLLRAGAAVVDTTEWTQRGRYALLAGARVVQLWHGVGFKRIEMDRWRREQANEAAFRLRCMLYRLSGRLFRYDAVLATSRFYTRELFQRAFLSRAWIPANYPRNTFGRYRHGDHALSLLGTDAATLDQVKAWTREGLRIVLFAPTFRDDGRDSLPMTTAERDAIETFCRARRVRLVIKMHPLDGSRVTLDSDVALSCAPRSDIYPLLADVSALVTDYSSIYMDFLVADRPILFHMPDLDRYAAQRDIQFDLADMTPGPRSTTWYELLRHLDEQLNQDGYRDARARLRSLAFDDHDPAQAVATVLRHLRQPLGRLA